MEECEVRVTMLLSSPFSYTSPFLDGASRDENEISHEKWCNDLAAKFLLVFVLDRFGDFVSDQVWIYSCRRPVFFWFMIASP